jgi:hypothetical protein
MGSMPRGPDQGVSPQRERAMRQPGAACLDGRIAPRKLAARVAVAQATLGDIRIHREPTAGGEAMSQDGL